MEIKRPDIRLYDKICPYCGSQAESKEIMKVVYDREVLLVPQLSSSHRTWNLCTTCGVRYSLPRLTDAQIIYMYENYRTVQFRNETPDQYFDRITTYPSDKSENFIKVSFLKKFVFNPSNVLDIGSGGGVLIHEMMKQWPEASYTGVEPTKSYSELAQRRTGATIYNEYYSGSTFSALKFDLITCCHVLEHIQDLDAYVFNVQKDLASGGYIFIEVPSIKDFVLLPESHVRFIEPSHLWYLSSVFLKKLFSMSNLRIIDIKTLLSLRGKTNTLILLTNS